MNKEDVVKKMLNIMMKKLFMLQGQNVTKQVPNT